MTTRRITAAFRFASKEVGSFETDVPAPCAHAPFVSLFAEKVLVELLLENSLQIRLFLGNVSLLWECKEAKQENEAESDESDNKVHNISSCFCD